MIGLGLWVVEMARRDALYDSIWVYLAKTGSHGTLTLMCWAFLLATRFRPIEWLFGGLDKVYKAHRVIGEIAFFLIFLHPIFLAVHFSDSISGFFAYLWFSGDWARNTGILALLFFAVLVVLSIYVKIAYHRWKRTHDFFGVLLVLIIIHGVISGGEIMQYPVLTIWHGFWVILGLSAYIYIRILYRFIGPQYDFVTESVEEVGDAITEIRLSPAGRPFQFKAGQFIYISFDADAVSEEPHPFSISSSPDEANIRLSIKRLGDWTQHIQAIKKGEAARVWGPYGHFSEILFTKPQLPAVFIGGGIGITPFLSMIGADDFAKRDGKTVLFYSVPDKESQVYQSEIRRKAEELNSLEAVFHLSDEEGFIDTDYLEKHLAKPLKEYLFFVCGPAPMMKAMKEILEKSGVAKKFINMEDFAIR